MNNFDDARAEVYRRDSTTWRDSHDEQKHWGSLSMLLLPDHFGGKPALLLLVRSVRVRTLRQEARCSRKIRARAREATCCHRAVTPKTTRSSGCGCFNTEETVKRT